MQKAGAVILGISADTPKAQKKFQEKYHLPFTLLADTDKKVMRGIRGDKEKNMYGKKVMGIARTTFVIGPDGKIQHVFNNVKAEGMRCRSGVFEGIGVGRFLDGLDAQSTIDFERYFAVAAAVVVKVIDFSAGITASSLPVATATPVPAPAPLLRRWPRLYRLQRVPR